MEEFESGGRWFLSKEDSFEIIEKLQKLGWIVTVENYNENIVILTFI